LRGVGAELDGGLVSGLSEVGEEVANLLLAGIDDLTGGRLVDGLGHVLTELLEASTQLFQKGVRREGGFGRHRLLHRGKRTTTRAAVQLRFPLSVGDPGRFATPRRRRRVRESILAGVSDALVEIEGNDTGENGNGTTGTTDTAGALAILRPS
jgi:hypothetical protein